MEGGLPRGVITELIAPAKSFGGASVIQLILGQCHRSSQRMALIDGQDSFDPASYEPAHLSRLLWIRSRNAGEALKAADLLLRDGNLPLVLLDLALNPSAQLRKIHSTIWYRFQRVLEKSSTIVLVLTPSPLVSSAEVRLCLRGKFSIEMLSQTNEQFLEQVDIDMARGENQQDGYLEKFA
jgi:hypothetical protein